MNFGVASKLDDPYLDLLKKVLTRYIFPDTYGVLKRPQRSLRPIAWLVYPAVASALDRLKLRLYRDAQFDPALRAAGRDHPREADTMIGLKRLDNIHYCIEQVLRSSVPGDLIETGVWRGGACIFMRAALNVYGDQSRKVWVADSFEGLPKPDGRFEQDAGDKHWQSETLSVSLDQVKNNFQRYGLLDDRVVFLKGWFKDTLPSAPIERIAIMRLDGDMYASTMDALVNLYPKLSPGGFVIIDDYGDLKGCREAVTDFRTANQISDPIRPIDGSGAYWQRSV
jgi:O-methyltransferase